MTPVFIGQLLGLSFACGLNLYATVAAIGFLSRVGVITELPPGLHGLQSSIIIGTAVVLYVVEAVVDRVHHADSLWDTVHTFIRPPAAAFLTFGMAWGLPVHTQATAAAFAFLVALAAHAAKAGFRVAVNAGPGKGRTSRISTAEDLVAVAFVLAALEYPATALAAGAAVLLALAFAGPRLWRAFALGFRCLAAWLRTLFTTAGWRDLDHVPRRLRVLVGPQALGGSQPRATRAAVCDLPGVGAYRNGWLVLTDQGPAFLFGGPLAPRRVDLPAPRHAEPEAGIWAHTLRVHHDDGAYTLYLLKDGPPAELTMHAMEAVSP